MAIYTKDKTIRLNVRISAEHACFLDNLCKCYGGISQSEAVRKIIESYFWGMKRNEDKQTDIDDKL